jgi:hypothetical protein
MTAAKIKVSFVLAPLPFLFKQHRACSSYRQHYADMAQSEIFVHIEISKITYSDLVAN